MSADVINEIRDQAQSLLAGGSRYRNEKIGVIAAYVFVSIASLFWAFSGENQDNELGARYGLETIAPLDDKLFFLENISGDEWTRVRIVLNRNYLYKVDVVEDEARLVLQPEDFNYFYYIPRPWGREDWELLSDEDKPEAQADPALAPELVEVRARQGRLDINVANIQ